MIVNKKLEQNNILMRNEKILQDEEMMQGEDIIQEETSEDGFAQMTALGMDERVLRAVQEMGFEKMSPIQEQAIPYLLAGKDIIGQAQTGTGKTAAFGIPMIQNVDPQNRGLQGVVLCPTRELAIQAAEEIRKMAKFMHGIRVLPVYGGQDITRQIKALRGVQIIVGTPGRVMDHLRRHTIKTDDIKMVVLDEADEMLNMGFREDMETILDQIPQAHQTALFSATMPKPILEITTRFQSEDAIHVKVAAKELTIPLVKQVYYRVSSKVKMEACARILEYNQPKLALIFCNTKKMVDDLTEDLKKRGYQAEGLHGDLSQNQRDTVMGRFRGGASTILIATDVAARGIDVDDVEVVINYDVPQDNEYYVHRIGRTGRAGRTGKAFTLISGREGYRIRDIERACKTKIAEQKLPGAKEVTKVRAERILTEVCAIPEEKDISQMQSLVAERLEETGLSAEELAAAFLKYYMGEEIKDIPEEERPRLRRSIAREGYERRTRNRDGRESYGRGESRSRNRRDGRNDSHGRGSFKSRAGRNNKSYRKDG